MDTTSHHMPASLSTHKDPLSLGRDCMGCKGDNSAVPLPVPGIVP